VGQVRERVRVDVVLVVDLHRRPARPHHRHALVGRVGHRALLVLDHCSLTPYAAPGRGSCPQFPQNACPGERTTGYTAPLCRRGFGFSTTSRSPATSTTARSRRAVALTGSVVS